MDKLESIHQKVIRLYAKLLGKVSSDQDFRSIYIKELNDLDNAFFDMEQADFNLASMAYYIHLLNESSLVESGLMRMLQVPKGGVNGYSNPYMTSYIGGKYNPGDIAANANRFILFNK